MKTARALSLFLCLVPVAAAWAQTPPETPAVPVPPSGQLLRSAPDFSRWEVMFTYPDGALRDAPKDPSKKHSKPNRKAKTTPAPDPAVTNRLQKVVTTKTGRIVHEQEFDAIQQTADIWYDGGSQYTKAPMDSVWYLAGKLTEGAVPNVANRPLPASGYRDMEVVKPENYAGMFTYNDRKCLVFTPGGPQKLDLSATEAPPKKPTPVETIAYVDTDTRRPVALETSLSSRIFEFTSLPKKMQILPDDLVAQIKNGEDARARLNKPADRPY